MANIIAIANQKGGVGKTATASALANELRRKGYNVLMIDADPQCNTTDAYKATVDGQATMYDLMKRECNVSEAIQHTETGDIIACDPELVRADNNFLESGREYLLKEAIEPILPNYDFVIIDTLPGLGVMLLNALTAAEGIIIPIGADRDSLQGLGQLANSIKAIRKYSNPKLKVYGLLVTMLFQNTNLAKSVIESSLPQIESALNTKTFSSKIRYTTNVKDARALRQPLVEYAPLSTAAKDYSAFVVELLQDIEEGK